MTIQTPKEVNILGSELTGSDGDKNRTYTLTETNVNSSGMRIYANGSYLHQGTGKDYTLSSNVITFLNMVWDIQNIAIFYFVEEDIADTDLGTVGAVRRILNKTSDELDDDTINGFLNEANRKLKSKYFKNYMLDKQFITTIANTGSLNRIFETYFEIKTDTESNVKVYYNGSLLTQDTNYTLDISTSLITLDSDYSIASGGVVSIFYIPSFFEDYANYMAAKRIIDRNLIDLPTNANGQAIYSNIKETLNEYAEMVLNKPHTATYRDHPERDGIW